MKEKELIDSESKKTIRRLMVWKYVVLLSVLILTGIYLSFRTGEHINEAEIAKGILYAVASAIAISLLYDVATRTESRLLVAIERREDLKELSNNFIQHVSFDSLPEGAIQNLCSVIASNEKMMRSILAALIGQEGRTFYDLFLSGVIDKQLRKNVAVVNRLVPIPGRVDAYSLEYSEEFEADSGKSEFLVVVSCDNDLYNRLAASGVLIDAMIGTSSTEWSDINNQLSTLSLTARSKHKGKTLRETEKSISPLALSASRIEELLGLTNSEQKHVRAFVFPLSGSIGSTYEFKYAVRNSLSHHYYYWSAENPMHLKSVEIDYGEMRTSVKDVSANCTFQNSSALIKHERRFGSYKVSLDALLWPGQGVMIVWSPES